jgi:hypothetical protein
MSAGMHRACDERPVSAATTEADEEEKAGDRISPRLKCWISITTVNHQKRRDASNG